MNRISLIARRIIPSPTAYPRCGPSDPRILMPGENTTAEGPQITTTEVVKAAAGNSGNGKEVMSLLLEGRGTEITIMEEVVKAAAGNGSDGKEDSVHLGKFLVARSCNTINSSMPLYRIQDTKRAFGICAL